LEPSFLVVALLPFLTFLPFGLGRFSFLMFFSNLSKPVR
jgi:hypothetical protein